MQAIQAVTKFLFLPAALAMAACQVSDTEKESSMTLFPSKDAFIDSENKDFGLGSEIRLYYPDALGLLAFDKVGEALEGRKLVKAELILNAWTDKVWTPGTDGLDASLEVFKASNDWAEGTGHHYWFDGRPRNNFAGAYSLFPEYHPPEQSSDPVRSTGITWSNSAALRSDLVPFGHGGGFVPAHPHLYPVLENTGRIVIDITENLSKMQNPGSLTLAVRLAPRETRGGYVWIYSKDHVSPDYAPRLALTFKSGNK